jgi:hypothetical protein
VTASRVSRRREMKEDGIENIEPNEGRELVHRVAKEWLGEAELIPISHLRLDLAEPISGWASALLERGLEILVDDLGRPCVRREVLGDLLREDRERLARIEAESAERAAAAVAPVPAAGIPALGEGASAMESIMAHDPGYQTATQEFGRPAPNFLAEELEAGRRADADRRSEAELLKKAQACSTGRTTSKGRADGGRGGHRGGAGASDRQPALGNPAQAHPRPADRRSDDTPADAGPHLAGYVERLTPGAVQIKLVSTEAGRTARALLEDQLSSSTSCCRAIRSGSSPTISTTSDRRSSSRGRQGVTCGRRCRWTA